MANPLIFSFSLVLILAAGCLLSALIFLMNIGLFILIYIITPWDPQELIGFTLVRLLIHVAPLAVLICAEQTKRLMQPRI